MTRLLPQGIQRPHYHPHTFHHFRQALQAHSRLAIANSQLHLLAYYLELPLFTILLQFRLLFAPRSSCLFSVSRLQRSQEAPEDWLNRS